MFKKFLVGSFTLGLLVFLSSVVYAGPQDNIDGYAWSSNIGWISFNCENVNCSASNYGVNLDIDENGYRYFSGYAWSSNIGWISFNENDVTGCPSGGDCRPRISVATGLGEGWGKAIAGESDSTDGWDGWVKLGGQATDGAPYGVELVGTESFEGWSWAGEQDDENAPLGVIGWISWSCVDSDICDSIDYRVKFKTVEITVTASSGGVVLSEEDPRQINCGDDCEGEYLVDSQVVLTAYPEPGYVFGGWTNCSPADTAQCTAMADFDKTVQVIFSVANFYTGVRFVDEIDQSDIVPGEGGTVFETLQEIECSDDECLASIDSGVQIDLTAVADDGYKFVRWYAANGDVPCADEFANPCSFVKGASDETAKAEFRKTQCNTTREDDGSEDGGTYEVDAQCFDINDDNELENDVPFSDNCPFDGVGECPSCNDGADNEINPDGYIDYAGFCSGAPSERNEADCNAAEDEDTETTWYQADPGCRESPYRTSEGLIDNRVREF